MSAVTFIPNAAAIDVAEQDHAPFGGGASSTSEIRAAEGGEASSVSPQPEPDGLYVKFEDFESYPPPPA